MKRRTGERPPGTANDTVPAVGSLAALPRPPQSDPPPPCAVSSDDEAGVQAALLHSSTRDHEDHEKVPSDLHAHTVEIPSLSSPPHAHRAAPRSFNRPLTAIRLLCCGLRARGAGLLQYLAAASLSAPPPSQLSPTSSQSPPMGALHRGRASSSLRHCHRRRLVQRVLPLCRKAAKISAAIVIAASLLGFLLDLIIGGTISIMVHESQLANRAGGAMGLENYEMPLLSCDCTGEGLLGDVSDLKRSARNALHQRMALVGKTMDATCSICDASLRERAAVGRTGFLTWRAAGDDDGMDALMSLKGQTVWQVTWSIVYSICSFAFPNTIALLDRVSFKYAEYKEGVDAQLLQDRQNRGIAGRSIIPATPWSFLTSLAAEAARSNGGDAAADTEPMQAIKPFFFTVVEGDAQAEMDCRVRSPIDRLFFHRVALPWLEIEPAAHRTEAAWMVDPPTNLSDGVRLPFVIPETEASRDLLRTSWLATGELDEEEDLNPRHRPEITVSVPSPRERFRSYFCADMPNVSRRATYYIDPRRTAVLSPTRTTITATPQQPADAHAGNAADALEPHYDAQCGGCTFHCIHPRLIRQARRRPPPTRAAAPAEQNEDLGALSWDVVMEDVDAGRVRLGGSGAAGGDVDAGGGLRDRQDEIVVTRNDLFTCKILNREDGSGYDTRRDLTNRALLLSSDVWLAHFGTGLPLFFTNHSNRSVAAAVAAAANTVDAQTTAASASSVPTRLLPVHTAVVYGESLQSFPDYALRQSYWGQFDEVYLPHALRQPLQRRHAATAFHTWTVTHLYLREFQLIVYLNQQLRRLREQQQQDGVAVTAADLTGTVSATSGVVPRLALELLHGADPLLLPLVGESLHVPAPATLSWQPPSSASWADTAPRGELLPFSADGRIPAIVVVISHCWHGRVWWLSELSRYYPVHNYGRCVIPEPAPLPGDAAPPSPADTARAGIPQRARYGFPADCSSASIGVRHGAGLASAREQGRFPSEGRSRGLLHLPRDYELRCVFRKYKYVLAFENSIEDDYVTEKVYNAMLSGALPLYIGAMNIADYVPHKLPVLPVLQMFPILNETAARLEEQRILSLHKLDEDTSRHVLQTHAAVLHRRAAAATAIGLRDATARAEADRDAEARRRHATAAAATATATLVANALMRVAQQASQNASAGHLLLFSDLQPTGSGAPLLLENAKKGGTNDNKGTREGAGSTAKAGFSEPVGTWPPAHTQPPAEPLTAAENTVSLGQRSFLQRVHRDVAAAARGEDQTDATAKKRGLSPPLGQRIGTEGQSASPVTRMRRVRPRPDREFTLTANTAFGFMEEVGLSPADAVASRRTQGAAGGSVPVQHPQQQAQQLLGPVEAFATQPGKTKDNTNTEPAADGTLALGGVFSKHFIRRTAPPAAPYEQELQDTAGAPLNGFAQLAAHLRALDADPTLIDKAGYFDWWRAESMEGFGEVFLQKLHIPHPICSICASALEKKEAKQRRQR